MEVCKTFDVSLSDKHVFGVTPAEQNFLWSCFHAFVIVTVCRFLSVLLLLYRHRNDMQFKHTTFPDLKNMGTFLWYLCTICPWQRAYCKLYFGFCHYELELKGKDCHWYCHFGVRLMCWLIGVLVSIGSNLLLLLLSLGSF